MLEKINKQLLYIVSSAALLITAAVLNPTIESIDIKRADTSPQSVEVNCDVQETGWLWTVPEAISFSDSDTENHSAVTIHPVNENVPIILKQGTTINISIQASSDDGFNLVSPDNINSKIPYTVLKTEDNTQTSGIQAQNNDTIMTFTAGQSPTSGLTQWLLFKPSGLSNVLVTGAHTDTITFTLDVQAPVIPCATFSKQITCSNPRHGFSEYHNPTCWTALASPVTLTWDELKLAENGIKYGYNASKITATSIGNDAFYTSDMFSFISSLTSITIPESVTSIGNGAFYDCRSLTDIYYTGTQEQWNAITKGEDWNYNIDYTLHCTDTCYTKNGTIIYCPIHTKMDTTGFIFANNNTLVSLTWEELKLEENGTTYGYNVSLITDDSIESSAFSRCTSLTSVTIPEGVTSIGLDAFYDCTSLTNINIPASVTRISFSALNDCDKLTAINVNENNQNYASEDGILFNKEKTTLIQYPARKTDTSYAIPSSVTSIEYNAFDNCTYLTSIIFEEGSQLTSIGNYAFSYCSSLTSIEIPNSVTTIGNNAFQDCSNLTSVVFEEGSQLTSIGDSAFNNCTSLTSVTIPNSVTSIGDSAFSWCSHLTSITYNGTQAQWNAITKGSSWNSVTGDYTIHCTDGDIAKS